MRPFEHHQVRPEAENNIKQWHAKTSSATPSQKLSNETVALLKTKTANKIFCCRGFDVRKVEPSNFRQTPRNFDHSCGLVAAASKGDRGQKRTISFDQQSL